MLEQDKQILTFLRDSDEGSVSRERILKAFKRSGARVQKHNGSPTIFFGSNFIAVGRREIPMSTPHTHYRERLSEIARDVLKYNEVRAKLKIPPPKTRPSIPNGFFRYPS